MNRLKEIFNSEAMQDRLEGAVLGAAAGFALTGLSPGAIAGGFVGLVMGKQRITETFNAAMQGRQMAYAMVPARAPKP
ncbi:MAG: hypothetical protein ACAH83_13090 [Alphaproteobacteria bacterium]